MSQHAKAINEVPQYTRVDFTAMRAYLNRIETAQILRLYYNEDDLEDRGIEGTTGLRSYLELMRDDLISRLTDSNPHVAASLQRARQNAIWSKAAIDYLVGAADATMTSPRPKDPVTLWFLPMAAQRLKMDDIHTLEQLMNAIRARGRGWYRPIPGFGQRKADTVVGWLRRYEDTLGALPAVLDDLERLFPSQMVTVERYSRVLVPFERMRLPQILDGSAGDNRHHRFPLISARNDYDAVQSYLFKFRGQDKTYRAYKKELERFLLWCLSERGKAMSSLLVDDCEAYKDFLANLPERWIGRRCSRTSIDWRPFAGQLSPESQRYAIQSVRALFAFLIQVRYLAGNPWVAVATPKVDTQIVEMQIDKALPTLLWEKLAGIDGILDHLCALPPSDLITRYRMKGFASRQEVGAQLRLVRALILLIGNTGMRREEIAFALRRNLEPHPAEPGLWRLSILGKRRKWRYVYPSEREIAALREHWADRGEDFDFGMTDLPLVSPVIIPETKLSQNKHADSVGTPGSKGFSPDGIYSAVTSWLKRIAQDELLDLTVHEREVLRTSGIHAFRHTFGTQVVSDGVPLDVVQKILGHASLSTTTLYVQSADARAAAELGKRMTRKQGPSSS